MANDKEENKINTDFEVIYENSEKDEATKEVTKEITEEATVADDNGAKNSEKIKERTKKLLPDFLTVSSSPHIKSPESTQTIMLWVIIALVPAFIWGIYSFGARAISVVAVSVVFSVIFEFFYEKLLKKPSTVSDLSAVVTGLLLGLNLPVTAPLWLPIVGAFFAIVIIKQLFGGIGKNFVNPALAARAFLFAWPSAMTFFTEPNTKLSAVSVSVPSDIIASATPLASLNNGTLPEGITVFDMFLGTSAGCIGEVSALLLLCGGILLLVKKIITWHIPVSFIGTVALLTLLFPLGENDSVSYMAYSIFSGGLFLGAIFMATDYATSPMMPLGKIIFGIGCGAITVFIRYFGGYNEGVSFAILIMNLFVWYIDKFTRPVPFGNTKASKIAEKAKS